MSSIRDSNNLNTFSPISTQACFSPTESSVDSKVVKVVNDHLRYTSPQNNFTKKPPTDLDKPSPADSIGSNCSSLCADLGELSTQDFLHYQELSNIERPSVLNLPKFGEKRPAEIPEGPNRFSQDLEGSVHERKKKITVKRKPTYELPSCESTEPPLSSIQRVSDGHERDDLYGPTSHQVPKRPH